MQATALIGVYDADGGPLGELAYVWGKVRRTRHCGLCDITHGPVRRKPAWDRLVAELGMPVELRHLNELTPDLAAEVERRGAPLLLARTDEGLRPVATAEELDRLDGSVPAFGELVRTRLAGTAD